MSDIVEAVFRIITTPIALLEWFAGVCPGLTMFFFLLCLIACAVGGLWIAAGE